MPPQRGKAQLVFPPEMHYLDRGNGGKRPRGVLPGDSRFYADILWNDLPKRGLRQLMDGGSPNEYTDLFFDGADNRVLRYCADFENPHTAHGYGRTGESIHSLTGLLAPLVYA